MFSGKIQRRSLNPVKAGVDELELFAVNEMKLHVDFVLIHIAVKDQLIGSGSLEPEVSDPGLSARIGKGDGSVAEVE